MNGLTLTNICMNRFLLFSALIFLPVLTVFGQSEKVMVVTIEGTIDNGIASYVERSAKMADEYNAETVIFHIDTFGGLVDAADKIRKTILEMDQLTVAYIDKNAASAGALITLACDSVYMAPGSSIGAATVVQGTGEKASEKMQSYMRGLMRSTAEENGRDPRIAEAMVDESIEIENVISEGKLLTLSTNEAVELGIADAEFATIKEVKQTLGYTQDDLFYINERWEESALRFLGSPVISSLLMLMMMGGLYFELQSPGVGFAGAISGIGAMLFFAPLYIMGLAESWEIVLFMVGVILILIEIFIIPGFGVAGISGIILTIFSLGAALIGNVGLDFPALSEVAGAVWTLTITLVLGIALIASLSKYLPDNPYFSKLVLTTATSSETGFVSSTSDVTLVNKTGVTVTPLRPSGIVLVNEKRINVVSDGDFVDSGESVKIVSSVGNRVVVTKLHQQEVQQQQS